MSSLATSPAPLSSTASQLRVTQACDDGVKFAELFYEKLDKARHTIGTLFHDNATLIWNGNAVNGKAPIITFYEKLPTISTHLLSVDAQPIQETLVGQAQPMMCVICSGRMKFATAQAKNFSQSFILTAENNVWKVVSDTYRNY